MVGRRSSRVRDRRRAETPEVPAADAGPPPPPPSRRRRLATSLIFGVILMEAGLRLVLGNFGQSRILVRSEDPEVCLETRADVGLTYTGWLGRVPPTTMRTSSYGTRGAEFSFEKKPGVLRIATVGDSFTFGQGVQEDEAFVQVAAQRLNERNIPAEVVNFGVPGHATPQSVALVRAKVLPTKPDIVLVNVFANDLTVAESYCLYGQGGNAVGAWALRNVYLGRLLFFLASPIVGRGSGDIEQDQGTPGERFTAALRDLKGLGRQHGFAPAVVLLTDREMFLQSAYCQGCEQPHDLAPETGVHVVDLGPVWSHLQEDIAANYIPGDDHFSVNGNRIMGEALGDALAEWSAIRRSHRP